MIGRLLFGVGMLWLITMTSLLRLVFRFKPSHEVDWLTRIYTRGQVALTLCRLRHEVSDKIDPDRPYLFVQNHVNMLDHCTMYASTSHYKQGIELQSHFDIRFYGPFMKGRGTLGVEPGSAASARKLFAGMKREVAAGRSLLVFPEGTRTRTGRVAEFKAGVFQMAARMGLAIVPVTVTGMFEVLPTPGKSIRPFQTVSVILDDPIETHGMSRDEIKALPERVHRIISDRVDAYYDALEAS